MNKGYMKIHMLLYVYYDISNKISKIKICGLSTHESHFARFLAGALLNAFNSNFIIYKTSNPLHIYIKNKLLTSSSIYTQ